MSEPSVYNVFPKNSNHSFISEVFLAITNETQIKPQLLFCLSACDQASMSLQAIVFKHISQVVHIQIDIGAKAMHGLHMNITTKVPAVFFVARKFHRKKIVGTFTLLAKKNTYYGGLWDSWMIKTTRDCNHPKSWIFPPGFPIGDSNPIQKFDKPYVGVDQSSHSMTNGSLLIVAPTRWTPDPLRNGVKWGPYK